MYHWFIAQACKPSSHPYLSHHCSNIRMIISVELMERGSFRIERRKKKIIKKKMIVNKDNCQGSDHLSGEKVAVYCTAFIHLICGFPKVVKLNSLFPSFLLSLMLCSCHICRQNYECRYTHQLYKVFYLSLGCSVAQLELGGTTTILFNRWETLQW